jgi:hypothetical protein
MFKPDGLVTIKSQAGFNNHAGPNAFAEVHPEEVASNRSRPPAGGPSSLNIARYSSSVQRICHFYEVGADKRWK